MKYNKIKKVIFPVGGLGTRFLPATKSIPKEMLPVASKPLIQYAFEEAVDGGIEQFIFITGRNKSAISNHFDHSYELQNILSEKDKKIELQLTRDWVPEAGKIIFMRQQGAFGLGHAILCAKDVIGDEPFAVILADEMLQCEHGFLSQMQRQYQQHGGNVIGVGAVEELQAKNYGIIDIGKSVGEMVEVKGMVEKPTFGSAPSNLSIVGRYILQPEIFNFLQKTKPGRSNEIQLTDAMQQMLSAGKKFNALEFTGPRFDCGNQVGFLEANISYALADKNINTEVKKILRNYSSFL
ncbi:MAG: UTP--glucose-1-phosphate uridylyltransferase GalU [Alphaproteobacteria bacterium]|jgi:UTP--glucose-1-phosphate uridylyltransferase